jgi:tetratricopeptide (TPR) repeat protein
MELSKQKDKYKMFAFKRIKGYLGLLYYSLSNSALKSNNLKDALKILDIYRLLEPQNPDMFYFSALYYNKKGNADSASCYLQKAIKAGYTDKKSIQENFPSVIIDPKLLPNQ